MYIRSWSLSCVMLLALGGCEAAEAPVEYREEPFEPACQEPAAPFVVGMTWQDGGAQEIVNQSGGVQLTLTNPTDGPLNVEVVVEALAAGERVLLASDLTPVVGAGTTTQVSALAIDKSSLLNAPGTIVAIARVGTEVLGVSQPLYVHWSAQDESYHFYNESVRALVHNNGDLRGVLENFDYPVEFVDGSAGTPE